MKLTDNERKIVDDLLKVADLAQSNWPRATEVAVETSGSDPHARMYLPASLLSKICRAALGSRSEEG